MNALETFRNITGYDISAFFDEYLDFIDNYYISVIDYYNGADINAEAFDRLERLTLQLNRIEPLIDLHQNNFQTIDMWEIVDRYGDIFSNLLTINNLGRWLRSSRTTQYDGNIKLDRVLRQGETFELVAAEIGSQNRQDDWAIIAIENLVEEEQYTTSGGAMFSVTLRNNFAFDLPNIIDFATGDNLYGKDIHRGFNFVNNDLQVVTFRDALKQTLQTILETRRGSIPEFPDDGIDDELIGSNVNSFQYPILFRNILNLFNRDPRFTEVNLIDLFRDADAIIMRIEVITLLRDRLITNINV